MYSLSLPAAEAGSAFGLATPVTVTSRQRAAGHGADWLQLPDCSNLLHDCLRRRLH